MTARDEFDERYADLRARYRAGRDVGVHEARVLRELWGAAQRAHRDQPRGSIGGGFYVFGSPAPPPWEAVELALGLGAEVAPVDAEPSDEAGDANAVDQGPSLHSGKDYRGELVEEVVRRASAGRIGRTLRNRLHEELDAPTYMIDTIFRLMRHEPPILADAGRGRGWLEVAGRVSATPAWINLHDLETACRSQIRDALLPSPQTC